jgi:hypothetical protein
MSQFFLANDFDQLQANFLVSEVCSLCCALCVSLASEAESGFDKEPIFTKEQKPLGSKVFLVGLGSLLPLAFF